MELPQAPKAQTWLQGERVLSAHAKQRQRDWLGKLPGRAPPRPHACCTGPATDSIAHPVPGRPAPVQHPGVHLPAWEDAAGQWPAGATQQGMCRPVPHPSAWLSPVWVPLESWWCPPSRQSPHSGWKGAAQMPGLAAACSWPALAKRHFWVCLSSCLSFPSVALGTCVLWPGCVVLCWPLPAPSADGTDSHRLPWGPRFGDRLPVVLRGWERILRAWELGSPWECGSVTPRREGYGCFQAGRSVTTLGTPRPSIFNLCHPDHGWIPSGTPQFCSRCGEVCANLLLFLASQRIPAPTQCFPLLTSHFTRGSPVVSASNLHNPPQDPPQFPSLSCRAAS